MIKSRLIEMTLFSAAKETENKLRWDADVEGTSFALYIPKWRTPSPWPSNIWVSVIPLRGDSRDLPNLLPRDVEDDPSLKHEPIVATLHRFSVHSKTVRYHPEGDPTAWEIGKPYVPKALIPNGEVRLRLVVMWDVSSRGAFTQVAPIVRM